MGGGPATQACFLGIEGGGTRTVALLADEHGRILRRLESGPLNLKLLSDRAILGRLRDIKRHLARCPSSMALCVAGCRTTVDRSRARALTERVWGHLPAYVGSDIESGLAAAFGLSASGIVIVSGTGSYVYGRHGSRTARAGGWGHLLGDHGSGYWIALTGLRAAIREYDRHGRVNKRLARTLRRLCLNSPDQLVDWIQNAGKDAVAALAVDVLDDDAGLMLQAASFLAQDCHAVALQLGLDKPSVILSGGMLQHHRKLAILVGNRVRTMLPGAKVTRASTESAVGALRLAGLASAVSASAPIWEASSLPLTEKRNPRTMDLHRRSVAQLVDTMLAEEARVIPALRKSKVAIERAVHSIVRAVKRGGRLFYIGAGTSGRLGVLDASECPPTFSTDPEMVQAIIAGGAAALREAVEGAEDDPSAGAEAMGARGVGRRDIVVGIAASSSTPFVVGALDEAKRRGAKTFLLCFSAPRSTLHTPLYFNTGPEMITGSTRLKAGTATKLVLNMLTTISMIRLGKVVSNLMVDVKPTNEKLRRRASRIVATLKACREEDAREQLVRCGWNVKKALR
jgi:N-acetylmuramic acid 6-phosphate etherase